MKLFLFFAFCTLAAHAVDNHINGEHGWHVPNIDGTFEWLDLDLYDSYMENQIELASNLSNPVTFYLFTQSNLKFPQLIKANKKSIAASNFNPKNPTRFTIHGWTSSAEDPVNHAVRKGWFSHGDMNMITVDWGRARSKNYASCVLAVPGVGEQLAELINFLHNNNGLSLDKTVIIGHSLGAHVAGFTGKNVKGQIHTIIGLDPALPLYRYDSPNHRLSSTDAYYVQSIQTNGARLGFLRPIGNGAFYPNGGKNQPDCGADLSGLCDHNRAVTYYAEAVTWNNFPTMRCTDYEQAVARDCGSSYSSVTMGAVSNANMVSGLYYVPVNTESPYGYGN